MTVDERLNALCRESREEEWLSTGTLNVEALAYRLLQERDEAKDRAKLYALDAEKMREARDAALRERDEAREDLDECASDLAKAAVRYERLEAERKEKL